MLADGWEPVRVDYANLRGLNYVPHWAGSSVGTWRGYDPLQVEADLRAFRGIGCNALRVWLSEAVYREEGRVFLDKLRDFFARCEAQRIFVMPVLWDAVGAEPSGEPYDDLFGWVKNPSTANVEDPNYWREYGDPYVEAVVEAVGDRPALLMWDVMNEPSDLAFYRHYARVVDALAPNEPITIGFSQADFNQGVAAWPEIDVLSFHPYGCFQENVEHWTETARAISAANGNKPILISEVGSPGIMQRYEDVLANIEREGVGFLMWQAMIGPPPHFLWNQDGFFFLDGEVRDLVGVQAFQDLSRRQGFPGVLRPLVEKDPDDPLYLPMAPIPLGFGGPELVDALYDWSSRPRLTASNLPAMCVIATWSTISLAWAGLLSAQDLANVRQVVDRFNEAVEEEDFVTADAWLGIWGLFNLNFVIQADIDG